MAEMIAELLATDAARVRLGARDISTAEYVVSALHYVTRTRSAPALRQRLTTGLDS